MLQKKKNSYKEQINKIAKESFNNEQKNIACQIIDSANEHNIDAIYQLISQRVKTGFVFDAAPEVNHDCVALIKENEKKMIDTNQVNMVEHKLIIGENYDALKNLLVTYVDSKAGKGLIDVIYIDPPYGTEKASEEGNDYKEEVENKKFLYRDKFTRDGWLNMMNERLKLARKLLSDNGVIFISIDDNNQAYLKVLMDEIFGENNFIASYKWNKTSTPPSLSDKVRNKFEYILCYEKKRNKIKYNGGYIDGGDMPLLNTGNGYKTIEFDKESVTFYFDGKFKAGKQGRVDLLDDITIKNGKASNNFRLTGEFKWVQETVNEEIKKGTKFVIKTDKFAIRYLRKGVRVKRPSDIISKPECGVETNEGASKELKSIIPDNKMVYPKPVSLIKYLIKFTENDRMNGVVLDFFAGSGTTGQAVMELNEEDGGERQFILVTNKENNIDEICWERLYRVINGKGSNGEKFDWRFSKDVKSLINNKVKVFDICYHELKLNDFAEANKLIPIATKEFKNLNNNYKPKDKFDIYNELSALNPYKEE